MAIWLPPSTWRHIWRICGPNPSESRHGLPHSKTTYGTVGAHPFGERILISGDATNMLRRKTPTFDMISISQAYVFLHPHCSQCLPAGFKYSIRCRLQGGFPSDAPPYPTHTWGEKLMEGLFQARRKGTGGSGNLPVCNAGRCR